MHPCHVLHADTSQPINDEDINVEIVADHMVIQYTYLIDANGAIVFTRKHDQDVKFGLMSQNLTHAMVSNGESLSCIFFNKRDNTTTNGTITLNLGPKAHPRGARLIGDIILQYISKSRSGRVPSHWIYAL